jgi:maltooligosyltrehalose trehalohydrolase
LHAVLTGERDGYYQDYGGLDRLARAINDGFVFQGEYSKFRGRRHGADSRSVPTDHLVVFAQNHDQVGNRAGAERLSSLVGLPKAQLAAAVLLLSPFVPLLFMGEEYAEAAPFPYFVDHADAGLLEAVRNGRAEEFGRGADSFDPAAAETFMSGRLDRAARDSDEGKTMLATYQALILARRRYPVITDPAVLETSATVVGDVLVLRRRSRSQTAVAAYNFGADAASAALPDHPDWSLVLDSTAHISDGAIQLAPFGFALCIAEDETR